MDIKDLKYIHQYINLLVESYNMQDSKYIYNLRESAKEIIKELI